MLAVRGSAVYQHDGFVRQPAAPTRDGSTAWRFRRSHTTICHGTPGSNGAQGFLYVDVNERLLDGSPSLFPAPVHRHDRVKGLRDGSTVMSAPKTAREARDGAGGGVHAAFASSPMVARAKPKLAASGVMPSHFPRR